MSTIYRIWWRCLMDLRPLVRYLAERFPHLAAPAVRTRTVAHFIVGNPLQAMASIYGLVVWSTAGFGWGFVAWLTAAVAIEAVLQVVRARGGHAVLVWIVGWREAWRVRRRWPSDWAAVAAKTSRVQAEVGTSREPVASARLRPIADHPKMSWWPRVEWPVVSWWVGPPPGRSFISLEEVVGQLAANISHCIDVAVDFNRESDSYARLVVTFADPLSQITEPAPQPVDDDLPPLPPLAVVEPVGPALVAVPDDADEWEGF